MVGVRRSLSGYLQTQLTGHGEHEQKARKWGPEASEGVRGKENTGKRGNWIPGSQRTCPLLPGAGRGQSKENWERGGAGELNR